MGNGLPMQTSLRMESEEEETSEGINSTGGIAQEELMEDSSSNSQQPCSGTLNNVPLLIQVYISAHDYSSLGYYSNCLPFQEIMDVEHLWFSTSSRSNEKDLDIPAVNHDHDHGVSSIPGGENMVQTLTNMADKRLFKLVKWCKSLPLFKNILVKPLPYTQC